jgi:phospholipid/cholesterol/gamma-HCH transport system permease protein
MFGLLAELGNQTLETMVAFGRFWRFFGQMTAWGVSGIRRWRNWRLLAPLAYEIGTRSVPVILVTGTFVGMVLAVQAFEQFESAGLEERMGVVINLSVVRELGPVLAGVMLAGRIGGALTAELGTMNVTEQIEALRSMGADPIRYLVVPRFLACLLLTPFLTIYCDVMGALGGWFITVKIYGVSSVPYWQFTEEALERWDLLVGFIKSLFFGAAIAIISCYKGFHCRHGAEGVGRACTESFVASFIAILVLDFFIGFFMQTFYKMMWGFKPVL